MAAPQYDVVVVGCGPVGAFAANLLGRAGLTTLVVEAEIDPYPLPRAVHLDHEMMRLFQAIGLSERLTAMMRETEGHLHVGADHGVIRFMGTAGRPRPFGWANDYFFYQPEVETVMREALADLPDVTFRNGTKLVSVDQEEGHVALGMSSDGQTETVRARWVIACDGARSFVRKALGIPLDDLDFEEPWLVVDAEVDGPVRFPALEGVPPEADLQKLSVMMCDPVRPATIVPGRGRHRRWEFMLLPGESDSVMMQPERVSEMVGAWLEGIPHTISRAATYRFHGLVADRWREGRIFLAGDAAHQTPPFFGQGMCHGLRDVANLVWKLELVAKHGAPDSLLDSYQLERDPHVRAVIEAAVAAGRYICVLDPAEAAQRDARMREAARNARPGTAADLIPAIAAGIVDETTAGAGERFIQPFVTLAQGRILLDDVTGHGWRLFARQEVIEPLRAQHASRGLPFAVCLVAVDELDDGGAVQSWLEARGAAAVLVRPDFYVFGTAPEDAATLIDSLAEKLGMSESLVEEAA